MNLGPRDSLQRCSEPPRDRNTLSAPIFRGGSAEGLVAPSGLERPPGGGWLSGLRPLGTGPGFSGEPGPPPLGAPTTPFLVESLREAVLSHLPAPYPLLVGLPFLPEPGPTFPGASESGWAVVCKLPGPSGVRKVSLPPSGQVHQGAAAS